MRAITIACLWIVTRAQGLRRIVNSFGSLDIDVLGERTREAQSKPNRFSEDFQTGTSLARLLLTMTPLAGHRGSYSLQPHRAPRMSSGLHDFARRDALLTAASLGGLLAVPHAAGAITGAEQITLQGYIDDIKLARQAIENERPFAKAREPEGYRTLYGSFREDPINKLNKAANILLRTLKDSKSDERLYKAKEKDVAAYKAALNSLDAKCKAGWLGGETPDVLPELDELLSSLDKLISGLEPAKTESEPVNAELAATP